MFKELYLVSDGTVICLITQALFNLKSKATGVRNLYYKLLGFKSKLQNVGSCLTLTMLLNYKLNLSLSTFSSVKSKMKLVIPT